MTGDPRRDEAAPQLDTPATLDLPSDGAGSRAKESGAGSGAGQPLPGASPSTTTPSSTNSSSAPIDADAPLSFSDFDLHNELGVGGMGAVYRATQKSLAKPVAVKLLKHLRQDDPQAVARFIREARTAACLQHAGIVDVHGLGRTPEGGYFLVMDLVEGVSLERLLREEGPLPVDVAVEILIALAKAVEHAHQKGVIHRDLKPSNVLVDGEGRALLTDFGLAKPLSDTAEGMTHSQQILGTPHYMAPEQLNRRLGEVGPHTDVYGLGGVLYTTLTRRTPVEGNELGEVLAGVLAVEPIPLRTLRPDVPVEVEAICLRCLAKQPAARFATASALIDALKCWRDGPPLSQTQPLPRAVPQPVPGEPEPAARMPPEAAPSIRETPPAEIRPVEPPAIPASASAQGPRTWRASTERPSSSIDFESAPEQGRSPLRVLVAIVLILAVAAAIFFVMGFSDYAN